MKKYIAFLLFFYSMSTAFAFVETDIDNYINTSASCTGGISVPFTVNSTDEMLIVSVVFHVGLGQLYTLTYNGISLTDSQATFVDTSSYPNIAMQQWFLPNAPVGTYNIDATFGNSGCLSIGAIAVKNLDLNPTLPLNYSGEISSGVTTFTQQIYASSSDSFLNWSVTAQGGATITGELYTIPSSQPEVTAFGASTAYNSVGSTGNTTMTLQLGSAFQAFRGHIVEYPSVGGSSTTTGQDYQYSNGSITTSDIFNMGSTTLNFGTIDYSSCSVSSITIDPFASSSLSWGTFDIPQCILQSFKLLLFGSDGFDTYNITNFVNKSSSTLPFLMFKFMGGALVYINPLNGNLINLPNASSSFIFSIPLFSTSSPILFDINASSSILNTIKLPEVIDKTASTIEIAVFFVMWAIIFRYINI